MTTSAFPPMPAKAPAKGRPGVLPLSRAAAAILGGYLLASTAAMFLAAVLPSPRAEAVLASTLLSFAIYTGAVIGAYAVHSLRRVWCGLLGASAALGAAGLWLARMGT